jgi:hypothetical protein
MARVLEQADKLNEVGVFRVGDGDMWTGGCRLPKYIMCVEWLKKFGASSPALQASDASAAPHAPSPGSATVSPTPTNGAMAQPPLPALGVFVPEASPTPGSTPPRKPHVVLGVPLPGLSPPTEPSVGMFPDRWVRQLELLGVELEMAREGQPPVFVVGARTKQDRLELTWVEVASLCQVLEVLPARLVTLRRKLDDDVDELSSRDEPIDIRPSAQLIERLKRLDSRTGVPKDELEARTRDAVSGVGLR